MLSQKLNRLRSRSYPYPSRSLHRKRYPLLALTLLCYILLCHLPNPPSPRTQQKYHAQRDSKAQPPLYDVEAYPRFLHRSPFRTDPNLEYEEMLEGVLRGVESEVLAGNWGDTRGKERIWQIMPRQRDRGSDSIALEGVNEGWEYTAVTDDWANTFVTKTLSQIPDLTTIYKSYPQNVLRADLLRYLVLWYYGGYYADMDIFPAKSIKACPSLAPLFTTQHEETHNVSLVVGVEIDEPYATPRLMKDWHWSRSYGFIQYTMYATRRFSPFLRKAIVRAMVHTKQHIDEHERNQHFFSLRRGPKYDERTILELTGPGVFTDAILDTLTEMLDTNDILVNASITADRGIGNLNMLASGTTQRRVTWAPFHKLQEAMWVGRQDGGVDGLGVLPISVWGNGQRHSGAEGFDGPQACVNHWFGRSWKRGWWEWVFG